MLGLQYILALLTNVALPSIERPLASAPAVKVPVPTVEMPSAVIEEPPTPLVNDMPSPSMLQEPPSPPEELKAPFSISIEPFVPVDVMELPTVAATDPAEITSQSVDSHFESLYLSMYMVFLEYPYFMILPCVPESCLENIKVYSEPFLQYTTLHLPLDTLFAK